MNLQSTKDERIAVWREALLLPGETDLIESGLRELAEYFGISREQARRQCEAALAESKREWEAAPRRTPDEIKAFYRSTRSYVFEHVWWHATDTAVNSANVEILNFARSRSARHYLDFGSGVGANTILFARHGFTVTLADVSATMLDFARWRLQRRGIAAEFIDLNRQVLPQERFDFATAVDVLEHLPQPKTELAQLSHTLKDGGALIFNCRAGEDPERPMHVLKTEAAVWQAMRACSFRKLDAEPLQQLELFAVERIAQSRFNAWRVGLYDRLRFSELFAPGANGHAVRHPQRIYFERIETVLKPQTRWLDVGCGRQLLPWWMKEQAEWEARLVASASLLVGLDPDFAAVRDNRSCHWRLNATAAALPFADESFDLVTCNMVFEHVRQPREVLTEIRRVLRPGGRLLALTPNWLDIVTLTARAVPNRWHPAIVSRLEARKAEDVYPTYFRFNRPATIERLLAKTGFKHRSIKPLEQPATYSHVPIVARAEQLWHKLAHRQPAFRGALLIEAEAK